MRDRLRRVVVLGGGAAGWMSAAVLAKVLRPQGVDIHVVESEEIGIVGVGEATIAGIHWLNNILGIREDEFVRAVQGTFKLGIEFRGWTGDGSNYYHPFGRYGANLGGVDFQHLWVKSKLLGIADPFEDYCMTTAAARRRRFARPDRAPPGSPLRDLSYAYHIDAGRYAHYLRTLATDMGVRRTEGRVVHVERSAEDGDVEALRMERGDRIAGDLFIDCSGMRALLIQETLQTGVHDLSHLLPCDRAWAVPTTALPKIEPSTRCTARPAGWQWRIPLQNRIGNGHVFCSRFVSEDEAHDTLMRNLDGPPLADARLIKFRTGRSRAVWNRNVIAVGLSAGFLEPLEATTIHIILTAINQIIGHLPRKEIDPSVVASFNRQMDAQFDTIKDFLVLHYRQSSGRSEPFWRYLQNMDMPERVEYKIEQFRRTARIDVSQWDQFKSASWFSVMLGQALEPQDYDPLADNLDADVLARHLSEVKASITAVAEGLPTHEAYIRANCDASVRR